MTSTDAATLEPAWDKLPETMTAGEINAMIDLFLASLQDEPPLAPAARPVWPPAHSFEPGDRLGDAVLVGSFLDGSPEWHEARKGGIGGSEISAIMGLNSWKSCYRLWLEKVGTLEPEDINPQFAEWGHRLEEPVLKAFEDRHPEYRVLAGGSWHHKDRPWQKANPDGLLEDAVTGEIVSLVECKTSMSGFGWGEESEGMAGVPLKYLAQVRWYMSVFGFHTATIIVLIGLGDYREYTITADPFETLTMVNRGKWFMDLVATQTAPPIDGGKDTYEYLRTVNPSIDPKLSVELPEEIADMVAKAKAGAEAAETELLRAKGHLLAHMGTAKTATYKGKNVAGREARGENVPFIKLK